MTPMTPHEWEEIELIIKTKCKPGVYIEGNPEEGYLIRFPMGVIHPASFLDLMREADSECESVDILKNLPRMMP
jgi:hypothetical protein